VGCPACFTDDADVSWANCGRLAVDVTLADDSHFIVQLRRCAECGQRYLWVFTEFVDYDKGEDAQYRQVVPVTVAEAASITGRGPGVDLAAYLGSLGGDRRYLRIDWPSDQPEPAARWSGGAFAVFPGY
jgi:hypothetical protein